MAKALDSGPPRPLFGRGAGHASAGPIVFPMFAVAEAQNVLSPAGTARCDADTLPSHCRVFAPSQNCLSPHQIQPAGHGVMTLEGAVHFGVNLGPNVATAWNCASRSWLRWGRVSAHCACGPQAVQINVEELTRTFLQVCDVGF